MINTARINKQKQGEAHINQGAARQGLKIGNLFSIVEWLKEKGTNYNFEWVPTEEIAEHIRDMAMEKTKNFKPVFPHHIMDIIRLSVVDYLNHKPFKRGLGLPFKKTSSVTPIELVDLKKIYSSGIF